MGFAKVHSGQTRFLAGQIIDIEIDLSKGLHAFSIVGLADKSVEEARDRISAAIKNSGFKSPKYKNQKVVISLAPADIRKAGPAFDVAMAIGYLLAAEDIRFDPRRMLFLGELSLDGNIRPVAGTLAIVAEAARAGFHEIFVPKENAAEAALVRGVSIFAAHNLRDIIAHINQKRNRDSVVPSKKLPREPQTNTKKFSLHEEFFLEDIRGQNTAKRALEITAAGGHNILLSGPPGTGKTMLAKTLRALLPPLSFEEALEVTSIHSIAGILKEPVVDSRPFRAPHHTSSHISLVGGGGGNIKPGEMTLAHRGVLFLDEFPEFDRAVIDTLREPLEERHISISRARGGVIFPADFMLVAAMNPCPCGFFGSTKRVCTCSAKNINRYSKKISGPILDRIDLHVQVGDIDFRKIDEHKIAGATTATATTDPARKNETALARQNVALARELQHNRLKEILKNTPRSNINTNAHIPGTLLDTLAPIESEAQKKLLHSATALGFSMRTYHRVWRVARTIADLEQATKIQEHHILEALQFRGGGEES